MSEKSAEDKAKEWNCSTRVVTEYCATGLIPPASKVGRMHKWMIPEDWPKPPMGRRGLCFLLDTIHQLNCGVDYKAIKWGYRSDDVVAGFDYLISTAFMSTINTANLESELKHAVVTPRGVDLIERENQESTKDVKFTAHVKATATIGIASIELDGELSNE